MGPEVQAEDVTVGVVKAQMTFKATKPDEMVLGSVFHDSEEVSQEERKEEKIKRPNQEVQDVNVRNYASRKKKK